MKPYLICYAPVDAGTDARIRSWSEGIVPYERVVVCRTTAELFRNLLRPLNDVLAVILLISRKEDLLDILSLKEVLHETRIILILPDSEPDLVAKGHMLRPRFVTYADEDAQIVAPVLHRIKEMQSMRF